MTVESSARPAATWPGLDAVPAGPRAAISAVVARRIFTAAVRRLPVTVHLEDGPGRSQVLGLRWSRHDGAPARRVLRATGPARPDRLRRGLPHRGLGRPGPGRLPDRARRGPADAGPRVAAEGRAPWSSPGRRAPSAARRPTRRDNIAHHYDLSNDLFATFLDETLSYSVGAVRHPDPRPLTGTSSPSRPAARPPPSRSPRPRPARSSGCSTRPASATAPGCSRSAPAGASWRSGPPAGARRSVRSRCPPSSRPWPASGSRPPAWPTGSSVDLCDYRDVEERRVRRRGLRRDDRGGRARVLADVLPDARPRPGARRQGRPSRRSDAARPDAGDPGHAHVDQQVHLPGRVPAVRRGIDEVTRDHTSLRVTERLSFGQPLRRDAAPLGRRLPRRARPGPRLGFDATFERMWHFYLEYSRAGFASGVPRRRAGSCRRRGERRPSAERLETASSPFVGGELPVRLRAWDGSRPARSARRSWSCAPRRPPPAAAAPGRARRRPGLRHRRARGAPRPRRGADPRVRGRPRARARRRDAVARLRSARARAARPRPSACSAGRPTPPATQARLRGRLHSQAAGPLARSATTTTCPTSSTR